jgi:hypothetical protein
MENKRLRHVVKALYRRCTSSTSVVDDQKDVLIPSPVKPVTPSQTSLSPPLSVSASPSPPLPEPSPPPPLPTSTSTPGSTSESCLGRGRRKRPKVWETSTRPTNDLCEVCAEEPPRKKQLLFAGCLHGMCRPCMTAHLKARRRCCHVCQLNFNDRLLEVGEQVTIQHVLSERQDQKNTTRSKPRARRKTT